MLKLEALVKIFMKMLAHSWWETRFCTIRDVSCKEMLR